MEKKKRDRKSAPRGQQAGSPRGVAAAATAASGAEKRKGGARGGPKTENEEQLL